MKIKYLIQIITFFTIGSLNAIALAEKPVKINDYNRSIIITQDRGRAEIRVK